MKDKELFKLITNERKLSYYIDEDFAFITFISSIAIFFITMLILLFTFVWYTPRDFNMNALNYKSLDTIKLNQSLDFTKPSNNQKIEYTLKKSHIFQSNHNTYTSFNVKLGNLKQTKDYIMTLNDIDNGYTLKSKLVVRKSMKKYLTYKNGSYYCQLSISQRNDFIDKDYNKKIKEGDKIKITFE